jgi:hypothetical protein
MCYFFVCWYVIPYYYVSDTIRFLMYLLCTINALLVLFLNILLIFSALFVRVGHVSLLVAPRIRICNTVVVCIVWSVQYWCLYVVLPLEKCPQSCVHIYPSCG